MSRACSKPSLSASRRCSTLTRRNPLLVDRGIKSLLGVPLFAGGNVIGVLHVGSLTGRTFSQPDVELLQLAADRAAGALHSLMSQDDALAAVALHRSLLPDTLPDVPGTSLAARYVTGSGNVGGDWYDVFTLPDGKLGIVVGDVAGSGLAAAVIMGRMRSTLRAYILQATDPAQALRMLDHKIQYFESYAMATVLYGRYDPGTGELVLSSAGHLPPVLATPAGHPPGMLPVQPDPPIGAADDPARHSTTIVIPPGALLCCFTNGLVERRDQPIDHGISHVAATLGKLATAAPGRDGRPVPLAEDACAAVMRALVGNAPAQDDIAVLTLHRHPDAEPDESLPQRPGLSIPRGGACQWRVAGVSARSGVASSLAKKSMKPSGSGPAFMATRWSKPASANRRAMARCRSRSGPQANCSLTWPGVTPAVTASKLTGLGSSDITFQPASAKLFFSRTARTALSSSCAHASGISP
jgi:phosphoserine phosphatase RsbU/P